MRTMRVEIGLAMTLLLVLASASYAATYYVAADGAASNDGSSARPWPSVDHALSQVGGGHVIVVKPGVYAGVRMQKGHQGTAERPTVVKSEKKWGAVLTGATGRGFDNDTGCEWVTVDGFEIAGARGDGIKMMGDHGVVRNCWVHNSSRQGILAGGKAPIIENNLVEFNGSNIQFEHGVYASGEGLTIRRNVVRHNAAYGLHLYSALSASLVANNVCYGNGASGIIVSCPEGGGRNRILGNTVVDNGHGLTIWRGKGEIVVNNLVVAPENPLALAEGTTEVEAHHNLLLTAPHSSRLPGAADPGFVNVRRSDYWLREGSPAVGKGDPAYALETDFWGRPAARGRAPDLGAFAFDPFLASEEAHRAWKAGWPYAYGAAPAPDFWSFPGKSK